MNWKLLLACVAVCGCTKAPDVALARSQNPAMARYADVHDCHPNDEWKPAVIVTKDGTVSGGAGKIFYSCPEDEILIMNFAPQEAANGTE